MSMSWITSCLRALMNGALRRQPHTDLLVDVCVGCAARRVIDRIAFIETARRAAIKAGATGNVVVSPGLSTYICSRCIARAATLLVGRKPGEIVAAETGANADRCSFCRRSITEAPVVAWPGGAVCSECVKLGSDPLPNERQLTRALGRDAK